MPEAVSAAVSVPPVFELIGIGVMSIEPGKAVLEMVAHPRHWNHAGAIHGGIISALADSAMGLARLSAQPSSFATIELKMSFLAKVVQGRLTATATVISLGRRLAVVECEVRDVAGRLVAKGSSTCLNLGEAGEAP